MDTRYSCFRFTWRVVLALAVCFMCACAVGPKYKKPEIETPAQFKETDSQQTLNEGWRPAQPSDAAGRGQWWILFNDDQLNKLEEQVNVSNQTLKVAEAQYREARALVRSSRADYYPQITTSPSITGSHSSENRSSSTGTPLGSGNNTSYVLPVDVSYEVDVWGRVRQTVAASRANAQASAADLETVRLSLQAELAADYFALRALDAQDQLLQTTVSDYQKQLQLTQQRHNAGVASGVDVAQAQAQLQNTQAQQIDLGVQRAQLEHAIAVLIGQMPAVFSIPKQPIAGPPPEVPLVVSSTLLERRPDVAAAERRVASANAQIGVAQSAFYPILNLAGAGGFESGSFASWLTWPSRFWSLGPTLVQTIFDGGRRKAATEQAHAVYDETVATYRNTVLTSFQDVEDNLAAIRILSQEAEMQDAAVQSAQLSLQLSRSRYDGGIAAYLEVLTAQAVLLNDQRNAVDLLQRRMTASVFLVKALGGGWNLSELPTSQDVSKTQPASPEANAQQVQPK